ncbi:HNH endonuclease signature motif containing protein [Microbacterium sp. CPCC 204701]|uniref:HNH endonuclease signature motif containing protein n=1 Tax=Microbacterium sp. CPCC 204701 TaxID=2493084 RepID=UPI0013E3B824|nr:HNH endonuclease signature motif containing protein [Microbacterium sp. CPCC 204701]
MRNAYRAEFLRSPEWFARRSRWFRKQVRLRRPLVCAACGRLAASRELELHHLDYSGVRFVKGGWRAFERHDDLVPLHPHCHDLLHRLIDRDHVLAFHRSRRAASGIALQRLRARLWAQEIAP